MNSKTFTPRRRPPIVVSCRRTGKVLRLTIRPRARHRTLRRVNGPDLMLGFANRGSESVTVHVTLAVH